MRTATWVTINSLHLIDSICTSGIDFIIVDMEHGFFNLQDLIGIRAVCRSRSVGFHVRLPYISRQWVSKALDVGVDGLFFPDIHCKEQAAEILQLSQYHPAGERGYSPFIPANKYDRTLAQQEVEVPFYIGLERPMTTDTINEILGLSNRFHTYVGKYDITRRLEGDTNGAEDLIGSMIAACKKRGRQIGTICTDDSGISGDIEQGYDFLILSVDSYLIQSTYSKFNKKVKSWSL